MKVNKGIKIRIKPNAKQVILLKKHFGANRWLWNYFLGKRIKGYQEMQQTSTYFKDCLQLTDLRAEHDWLREVSCNSQQRTLKSLDDAYKRFFKKKAGFPNFKKKNCKQSFTLARDVSIKQNKIYIPKFNDGLKFNRELPHFDKINNIIIKQTQSGKYYAVLSVECEVEALPLTGKEIGIDLGIKDFAVMSNGKKVKAHKVLTKLKRLQQHLSRKKKGSNRFNKQRLKLAKAHEKITNSRNDFLHKVSSNVVNNFDLIVVEDLAIKNMVQNHNLARVISEASWGEFINQLEYKSLWYGKELVKVDRFYPSTKTCSCCGWVNQSLTLKDRQWVCSNCGTKHDRDTNAAVNVLREGKRLISERLSPSNERGEGGSPELACKLRLPSMKRLTKNR